MAQAFSASLARQDRSQPLPPFPAVIRTMRSKRGQGGQTNPLKRRRYSARQSKGRPGSSSRTLDRFQTVGAWAQFQRSKSQNEGIVSLVFQKARPALVIIFTPPPTNLSPSIRVRHVVGAVSRPRAKKVRAKRGAAPTRNVSNARATQDQ